MWWGIPGRTRRGSRGKSGMVAICPQKFSGVDQEPRWTPSAPSAVRICAGGLPEGRSCRNSLSEPKSDLRNPMRASAKLFPMEALS